MADFLDKLQNLSDAEKKEEAIDLIFDTFDKLQSEGSFGECDDILYFANINTLMPTLLRSFLTITWANKDKLPGRTEFYNRVKNRYLELFGEERTKRVLDKLC